jgi:hypothetical protein
MAIAIPEAALGSECRFRVLSHYSVEFLQLSPRFGTDAGLWGIDDAYYFSLPLGAKAYSPHHEEQF